MMKTLKVAVLLLSVALLSVGFAGCSGSEEETPAGEAAETAENTEAAPVQQASGVGIELGQTPPAFVGRDLCLAIRNILRGIAGRIPGAL